MSFGLLLFYAPNIAFRRTARNRLKTPFEENAEDIWNSACAWKSQLAPKRPRHSASVNLMMRYMEWSCALYHAMQDHGVGKTEAAAFIETVVLDIFRPVPPALFKVSRLRSAKRETRVKWLLGKMTRYFFSAPFQHRHLPSDTGVSFDVLVCPFADYFKDRNVPELTPHAACNIDFEIARAFGFNLARSHTIAEGAESCDFRWSVAEKNSD